MCVVLLRYLRKLFEPDAGVVVGIFHSRHCECSRHQTRAQVTLDRPNCVVATGGVKWYRGVARLRHTEQAGLAHLFETNCERALRLASFDRHQCDTKRRRSGSTGVGNVVDRYSSLTYLLLQSLTRPTRLTKRSGRDEIDVSNGETCVVKCAQCGLTCEVDRIFVWVPPKLRHRCSDYPY